MVVRFVLAALVLAVAVGCGDDGGPTTPTSPTSLNRAPQATGSIPDVTLIVNGSAVTIDIVAHFSDPDGGPP